VRTFLLYPHLFFEPEAHITTAHFKRERHSSFEIIPKSYESATAGSQRITFLQTSVLDKLNVSKNREVRGIFRTKRQ